MIFRKFPIFKNHLKFFDKIGCVVWGEMSIYGIPLALHVNAGFSLGGVSLDHEERF